MKPLVVALPGNETLAAPLAAQLEGVLAAVDFHRFPDEETYVRWHNDVSGRDVVLVCTLDRPDAKFLPLAFCAETARELGASQVGLIAPYLAYMRQDRRFHPGEAVNARIFARQLSATVDWLITVDPHLHRIGALSEIYSIPTVSIHAVPFVADWIKIAVPEPLLIGPDEESAQWVAAVAERVGAPCLVLRKVRYGDTDVEVSVPLDIGRWQRRTPVLVDDIISTGGTMIQAIRHLGEAGIKPAVCVGVHAVFARGAPENLRAAGAAQIVTTNTIAHATNAIDLIPAMCEAAIGLLG